MVTCESEDVLDAGKLGPMSYVAFRLVLTEPPRVVSLSGEVEQLLGYGQQDFLGAKVHFKDCVHRDDAPLIASLLSSDLEKRNGNFNLRLRRADGKIICACGKFKKERSDDGSLSLELQLADARSVKGPGDAALISSFKSLIEHSTDYIYIKNRNHVILAASRALPSLIESNGGRTTLVGTTDYDNHPEETADIYYALEEKVFAEGRRANLIHQVRLKDGSKRWIENRKYPINGPDGEIIGIFGVAPDITDYIEAQNSLRESEERLREAQQIAGLGNYVLDMQAREWHLSPVLEQMLGIDAAYGREFEKLWPLIHPDDHAPMAERLNRYFQGDRSPYNSEYRIIRHSDGAIRWVHTRGRLELDVHGKPHFLRGTVQDITDRKQTEASLRESKDLLQQFIEHAPAALAMFDTEMRYLAVSRRWLEIHFNDPIEVIGRSHYDIFPEIPAAWRQEHQRALAGETIESGEAWLNRTDGRIQCLRREILPWWKGDGTVGGIMICSEDITPQKELENRLRLAASVFTGAREGITITDGDGTILEVNQAFSRITGYTRDEAIGRNPRILKSGLQSREFYENMWRALLNEGHWSGEVWNRSKSGDIYPESLTINAIRDANGKTLHYVALFSDISEIKEHEQQLEHVAHFDALTGLPNRALFADRLRQAMAQAHRSRHALAVVHFDLDGFKEINDRYGHSVGDGLLTAVAFRMKRALREGDTLSRLGGDEFAAVMLELDNEDSVRPALSRLLEAASEEAQIGEATLRVSASAGVTFYPQPEEVDADVLLRQAGQAMYQAKLAGGNRYCEFDPGQDLIARSRHENLEHIRQALAKRQFVLHYQPKVNMRTGKIVGAEALVRWEHPERGLLPPGMFLPLIEDHPLSIELGEWALESVLTQMESWQAQGLDLPVSVNVSAIELQQPDYADRLRAHLAAHPRITPESLGLEVVETSALQDVMQTSHVLKACRDLGVSIALDDFGIGYSSLTYLRRLPASVLKIDQSFVRDMIEEPENLTILEGVFGLASAFRREVIAEGVETVDHGLMLLQMGCELAQGYGIARPMPADALTAWAAHWRPDPCWADVPPVHASNRPVLYACVEHRAWLSALEACLQGRRTTPPPLDANHCRVGTWLHTEKQSARGTLASIQAIEVLHQQLHGLAEEIFESQAEGRNQEGLARLQQLHYLHEKCLSRLRNFTRISPSSRKRTRVTGPVRSRDKRS
jgi:diguanylate cyclase (GGDEF)-like protein/PAS domain S-box-containing protein